MSEPGPPKKSGSGKGGGSSASASGGAGGGGAARAEAISAASSLVSQTQQRQGYRLGTASSSSSSGGGAAAAAAERRCTTCSADPDGPDCGQCVGHSPDLDARLREVEEEYKGRLADLQEWRLRERLIERAKILSYYEGYPVGTNQFCVVGGSTACTSLCLAATLYVLENVAYNEGITDSTQAMPHLAWETIAETGVSVWNEYMDSHTSSDGHDNGYVSVDDLLLNTSRMCSILNKRLCTIMEFAGHVLDEEVRKMDKDAAPYTVREVVESMDPRSACVFTAKADDSRRADDEEGAPASSVVVIRLGPPVQDYWIYDPHGNRGTKTQALLIQCVNAGWVSHLLRSILPCGLFSATLLGRG